MKLTELFSGKTNMENSVQNVPTQQRNNTADINRQIRALVPGQTIHGEIVGRNGSEVRIKLAEDMVLNARVDQNINLELGKALTFEVKNNGAVLMLSPLFTNVASEVNVLKALDMAGLPVNETSVQMAKQLMEAGLPVNKTTLQQVYREIHAFAEGEISDVINLHKLQMPVNESNMEQMAAYRNLTYQLTNAMDTVLSLVPRSVDNMLAAGNVQEAGKLYQMLFTAIEEETALAMKAMAAAGEGGVATDGIPQADVEAGAGSVSAQMAETVTAEAAADPAADPEQVGILTKEPAKSEGFPVDAHVRNELSESFSQTLDKLEMTPEAKQTFAEQIKAFAQGEGNVSELFQLSEQLLRAAENSGREQVVLRECFGRKDFQNLLSEQLKNLWTIRPQDVAEPEKVTELYKRLDRQLDSLTRALEAGGQTESGAYKAASVMSQNLDFLQQLNQMYAYVQLPLHLQQGKAHGDLYVYANRKGLASRGGQVSALLHLDMEHLGPVDVHVTLQDAKVSTKFYVQDDEMLDFLEEHMDLLTQRLKKRGYDCDFSMTARSPQDGKAQDKGLQPILQQDKGVILSQYAFDVRT